MRDNIEKVVEAEPKPKPLGKTGRVMLTISVSIIIISILMCGVRVNNSFRVPRATADAEWLLTEAHGEEVFEAIQKVEYRWDSPEANVDPSIRLELAVTPALQDFMLATPEDGPLCEQAECYGDSFSTVTGVRVLEYSPERFKAIACTTMYKKMVTPNGEYIHTLPQHKRRALYVFIYVEDTWKVEGALDVTIPKDAYFDWDYGPEWWQEVIGPLPHNLFCDVRAPN